MTLGTKPENSGLTQAVSSTCRIWISIIWLSIKWACIVKFGSKKPVVLSGKSVIFKTLWIALFRISKRAGNITCSFLLCHNWAPLKQMKSATK